MIKLKIKVGDNYYIGHVSDKNDSILSYFHYLYRTIRRYLGMSTKETIYISKETKEESNE